MIPKRGREIRAALELKLSATVLFALLCFGGVLPSAWGVKHSSKILTTSTGSPLRKVYVRSASPDMANSAATELAQDTCLTVVPDTKQADAVLDVGIALPGLGGGGAPTPDTFGPSIHPQTMGEGKSKPQRSFSATCSDDKGGGCTGSSTGSGNGGLEQPSSNWSGNVGANLDVLLTEPGDSSQELWEPNAREKRSWSDQLRQAAGCPVCPGEHFNRRKYPSYRSWIQAQCPAALSNPSAR